MRQIGLVLLIVSGIASLSVRILSEYKFDESALLYVGIPYAIAVALLFLIPSPDNSDWKRVYLNLCLYSLIVMLASSIILFEGFLCVVMFMPIYFGVILLVFALHAMIRYAKDNKSKKLYSHLLPTLILISAFEGTTPELSFERMNKVEVSRVVQSDVATIRHQLTQLRDLNAKRSGFLRLFPMPHTIQAGSLELEDIHTLDYRYHR
ncbi:hypothetical protein [Pleionea sp. CnH1-48]|uniref:hypothetical protein n=1 Tax=Pleionea sp. CnH1-48 TaxID=2954494 RepID=UPI002097A1EB|nr:hypothetical protein [Pleionea sp. CnH1-48]MCO7223453.1 hypothetical protein [Pleionea sp. CnH1-48]